MVQPPTQGAQAQPTDIAQQFTQMMQALAQGQNQLQQAIGGAYTQQTAIAGNIATSVEVRDSWDSWYFNFREVGIINKNAGRCIQLLEEHPETQRSMTHLWKKILKEPSLFQLRPDRP